MTTSTISSTDPRTCNLCGETKTVADFHRQSSAADGYKRRCKECVAARFQEHYASKGAEIRQQVAEYRAQRPGLRQAYYAANKEREAASHRAYRAAHPGIDSDRHARRRAREGAEPLPHGYKAAMVEHYGDVCLFPGCARTDLTFDHVVPLALGGPHVLANGQLLCVSHNSSKGARHTTDYRDPSRGILTGLTPEGGLIVDRSAAGARDTAAAGAPRPGDR